MLIAPEVALAAPKAGPAFELGDLVDGAPEYGERGEPRVAAGELGTLFAWPDMGATSDVRSDDWSMFAAVFVAAGSTEPTWLPPIPAGVNLDELALAWAGKGFVLAYRAKSDIVAVRLDPYGALLDPAPRVLASDANQVGRLDLECDLAGRCLACWSSWSASVALNAVAFGWDTPPKSAVVVAEDSPEWESPAGSLARGDGTFGIAFMMRSSELGNPERRLFSRMLSTDGVPLAEAQQLPVGTESQIPELAKLADGYLMAWRDFADQIHAVRLDGAGLVAGPVLTLEVGQGDAWTLALSSEGDSVVLFDGARALRVDGEDQVTDLGPAATDFMGVAAAYDGTDHWIVGQGDQIYALRPGHASVLLSSAHNSQSDLRTAVAPDGASSIAAWNDNRDGGSDVYVRALGPDGCPVGAPSRLFPHAENRHLEALAADDDGALALAWLGLGEYGEWPAMVRRVSADGVPETAEPRVVVLPWDGRWTWVQPNLGGGFTASSGAKVVVLDANGDAIALVPIAGNCSMSQAVRIDDGIAVFRLDGDCGLDGFYVSALEVDFLDLQGNMLRPPVVEASFVDVSSTFEIFTTSLGYVLAWRDLDPKDGAAVDDWRVGMLTRGGEWSGLRTLPVGAKGSVISDVIADAGGLSWILVQGRDESHPGRLWLLRTTADFELVAMDDLGLSGSMTPGSTWWRDLVNALVPGDGQPTLLTPSEELPPRSVRVHGQRLDGSACVPPGVDPRSPRGSVNDELQAAGGCACGTPRGRARTAPNALLLLVLVAGWRRRRARSKPLAPTG